MDVHACGREYLRAVCKAIGVATSCFGFGEVVQHEDDEVSFGRNVFEASHDAARGGVFGE